MEGRWGLLNQNSSPSYEVRNKNMNESDFKTVEMMSKYGGSFVKMLAKLAHRADPINLEKIKSTWPKYWGQYEQMANEPEDK